MRRKLVGFATLLLGLLLMTDSGWGRPSAIALVIDGRKSLCNPPPRLVNGRMMLPLSPISERYKWRLKVTPGLDMLRMEIPGTDVILKTNFPYAVLNHLGLLLDTPPIVSEGQFLVPLTFFSDGLGFKVDWNRSSRTVALHQGTGLSKTRIAALVERRNQKLQGRRIRAQGLRGIKLAMPELHVFGPGGVAPSKLKPLLSPGSIPREPGDIVLRGEYTTSEGLGFFYTHAAIVGEDTSKILHITGELFSDLTTLNSDSPETFWYSSYAGAVIRPRISPELRLKAARWAATAVAAGKVKFKLDANWPVDSSGKDYVNCSSFVERAYSEGAGVDLGLIAPPTSRRAIRSQLLAKGAPVRVAEDFFFTKNDGFWIAFPSGNLFVGADGKSTRWLP